MRALSAPILRIAAEGWVFLLALGGGAVLALMAECWVWAAAALLLLPLLLVFFHDAPRQTLARPLGMLAPVDGVVSYRRECHDPFMAREAIRIGIQVPWFANYLLRAPVEGEVTVVEGAPAGVSCLLTDEGEVLVLAVRSGSLLGARPVWAAYGDRVGQGRICGARRLLRTLDVYLPSDCRVEVQLGQQIRCGETVLATLLRRNA